MNDRIEYVTSFAATPEENILRGLFTYFLNTGAFDARMKEAKLSPDSARTDHVGAAFIEAHPEVMNEFLAWAKSDDLADFLLSSEKLNAFRDGRVSVYMSPFGAIAGTRFKKITDFVRKRLPKDLKKSFYTKVSNLLMKFVAEWSTAEFKNNARRTLHYYRQADSEELPHDDSDQEDDSDDDDSDDEEDSDGNIPDVEEWLQYALSEAEDGPIYLSKNLVEIRNLYVSYMKLEPLNDVVAELMKQAMVAQAMA